MGMRPEGMERWGAATIFKESARLLHKHYRVFLPFFLALYLPNSIAQTLFFSPSSTPFLFGSSTEGSVNTGQTTITTSILSWTLFSLFYVLGTLGAAAVYYITDYLYTPTDIDDDRSIFPKVIKFLPRAFLRVFITELWIILSLFLLSLLIGIIGGILQAIMFATAGWSDSNVLFVFVLISLIAGIIFLAIVFALAQVIAVLEPGNYGREALKRSTKLVRSGRAWTIVAVILTTGLLGTMLTFPKRGIITAGTPVWAKVVLGVVIGGLDSVIRVYIGVVSVVMYFVYKARFDAAGSAEIQVFKRIDSAEHSYGPIVEGKGSDTFIGEP